MLRKAIPFFFVIFILFSNQLTAGVPDWVNDAKGRLESAVIDDDAPAVVLEHKVEVKIDNEEKAKSQVWIATKILKPSGTEAGVFKELTNDWREISNLKGWRITEDGTIEKLEKDDIVYLGRGQSGGYYDDNKIMTVGFDDPRVGDIIAYEYEINARKHWNSNFHTFIIQTENPVLSAYCEVTLPDGWVLTEAGQNIDGVNKTVDDHTCKWQFTNLPYQEDEPYTKDPAYQWRVLQIVCFDPTGEESPVFDSWAAVADWAGGLNDTHCVVSPEIESVLDGFRQETDSPVELLKKIAEYVRKQIRYVAVELGEGRFEPRDAELTFRNSYGDCKDKTTLMRTMLKAVGIESAPVFAAINDTILIDLPSPFQFNHVLVGIKAESVADLPDYPEARIDGWLYFDPTSIKTPLGRLPKSLFGANVLLASKTDPGIRHLPELTPDDYRREYKAEASIDTLNNLTADVRIVDYGVLAVGSRHWHETSSTQDFHDYYRKFFADAVQNPVISDFTSEADGDSCWVTFKLTGENYLSQAADYHLIKLDFFHAGDKYDKLKKDRRSPIWFGNTGRYSTEIDWTLPDGWYFDENPDTIDVACQISTARCSAETDGNKMSFNSLVEYNGGSIPPSDYRKVNKFLKKRSSIRNITAILHKQ